MMSSGKGRVEADDKTNNDNERREEANDNMNDKKLDPPVRVRRRLTGALNTDNLYINYKAMRLEKTKENREKCRTSIQRTALYRSVSKSTFGS